MDRFAFDYPAEPGLVTVICPVYNGKRYLTEALQSVINQDYPRLELIVVDDGSTDGSREIAEACPGVRCVAQTHRGVSAARNAGIREARGEYLAFIDADDRYLPGRIRRQVELLAGNPNVSMIEGLMRGVLDGITEPPHWVHKELLREEGMQSHSCGTLLMRREVFERVGLFNESLAFGEDTEWQLRLFDAKEQRLIEAEVVLEYRLHLTNSSYGNKASSFELLHILHGVLARRRSAAAK